MMDKIDWKQKLSSRKPWAAPAGIPGIIDGKCRSRPCAEGCCHDRKSFCHAVIFRNGIALANGGFRHIFPEGRNRRRGSLVVQLLNLTGQKI